MPPIIKTTNPAQFSPGQTPPSKQNNRVSNKIARLLSNFLLTSSEELKNLVDNSTGIAASEHLTDNTLSLFTLLHSQERTSHSLICAGLTLLPTNGIVNALGLLDLLLSGPAVNQSVGDVRSQLYTFASHVREYRFGSSNLMVGYHSLKERLVKAGADGDERLLDDGIEHLHSTFHVMQNASPSVDKGSVVNRFNTLARGTDHAEDLLSGLHINRIQSGMSVDKELSSDVEAESVRRGASANFQQLLVELLSTSTVAHSKTGANHGIENARPSVTHNSILGHDGHIGAGHGEDVIAQIDLTITSSGGDELSVGNVARMSASTSHVSETVERLAETRSFAAMATLKIVGNKGRTLEIGVVGIGVLTGVNNASGLHVSRDELGALIDLFNKMGLGLGQRCSNSLEHHLRLSQTLCNLSRADQSNSIHGCGLDKSSSNLDLRAVQARRAVAGVTKSSAYEGIPFTRFGLNGLGPVKSFLVDSTGDEALDETSCDESVLDIGSADTILVNNLFEKLHGTLNLVGNHIGVDDCSVNLGVKEYSGKGNDLAGLHVLEETEHVSDASIFGTCSDQLVLDGVIKTFILTENSMLKFVGRKHELARLIHATEPHPLVFQSSLQLSDLEASRS
ncbi:hypothetical protein HG531_010442 [Fusarium graminearum]|nr:hypothetical protein HG531_010442 [Fusarium graminearum]